MKTRLLNADDVPMLAEHLLPLAEYHNRVAESFAGMYPLVPFEKALADTAEMLAKGEARAEVLYDDQGRVAGYCVVHFHDNSADIDWLFVREDLRGSGWGKKLLDNALQFAKENGAEIIDLLLVKGNPAKKFYADFGFETRMEVMTRRL